MVCLQTPGSRVSSSMCVSVSSRSGRVQLWDSRRSTRRTPLRFDCVGSHRLHRLALTQEEAEEEKSQRVGPAGSEEASVSMFSTSPAGQ